VFVNLSAPLEVGLASVRRVLSTVHILEPSDFKQVKSLPLHLNLVAIRSERADLLKNLSIDGAFNVSSMQEMELSDIARYFDLLRASPSPATCFYCANAIEKIWTDGTVIRFADYFWSSNYDVLLDDLCPWAHRAYDILPPRYIQRPFRIQHRLAYLHKIPSK